MNFNQREQWLGIREATFRKRFIFDGQQSPQAFYFDRLEPTPSELDGLSELDEDRARSIACQMIIEAGLFLRMPVTSVVVAETILHFFYQRASLLKHDFRDIAMGAVFLAGKCEETVRPSQYVAQVFDQVFKVYSTNSTQIHERERRPVRVVDMNNEFPSIQAKVRQSERVILIELGFEVHRLLETPHRYMNTLFLEFSKHKRINEIVKRAWGYLNDSYRTRVCVHYPGQIIAAACVELSLRYLGIASPSVPWWCLMEASKELIDSIAADILSLYERCDTFSVVQQALTRAGSAKNLQHVFPVTYYRKIYLSNRQAQKQKQLAQEVKPSLIPPQLLPQPVQAKPVVEEKAQQPTRNKEREASRDRSRSRKDKKKSKHKHKHRSRSRSPDSDRKRRRSRSRSRNSRKHREQSRERKKKHRKEKRSDGEDSKQNITKSPAPAAKEAKEISIHSTTEAKVVQPVGAPQITTGKAAFDKEQLKKQIQEQIKQRLPKKPEAQPSQAPAASCPPQPLGVAPVGEQANVCEDDEHERNVIAELRAKILRRKQQPQPQQPFDQSYDPCE